MLILWYKNAISMWKHYVCLIFAFISYVSYLVNIHENSVIYIFLIKSCWTIEKVKTLCFYILFSIFHFFSILTLFLVIALFPEKVTCSRTKRVVPVYHFFFNLHLFLLLYLFPLLHFFSLIHFFRKKWLVRE